MQLITHLAVGLLIAIPFVEREKRLYLFVVGAIGALLPDIDLLIEYFDHRSVTHSLWVWLVITGIFILELIILNGEAIRDIILVFQFAWLSHLILDFGFTQTWFYDFADISYEQAWFFNLSNDMLSFIDSFIFIPVILFIIFWYVIK